MALSVPDVSSEFCVVPEGQLGATLYHPELWYECAIGNLVLHVVGEDEAAAAKTVVSYLRDARNAAELRTHYRHKFKMGNSDPQTARKAAEAFLAELEAWAPVTSPEDPMKIAVLPYDTQCYYEKLQRGLGSVMPTIVEMQVMNEQKPKGS